MKGENIGGIANGVAYFDFLVDQLKLNCSANENMIYLKDSEGVAYKLCTDLLLDAFLVLLLLHNLFNLPSAIKTKMRQLILSAALVWSISLSMNKPDLYVWLERNSYICEFKKHALGDLSTTEGDPRFLFPDESKQFACDCGDPLISRSACARHSTNSPTCHAIPDLCMREYAILFTETINRLSCMQIF
ncbi:hypothetical protein DICVIV_08116 [Dictyocaulus viviparus]|uniref:Uncharacterized protein n=1 Tax=Dictyocaulus viviparus TaxID=29172 RepID=A0A0D8XMH3_DICVI|nr:hypothetical protein DICVIV_08116 [Dictyocaulus viviparus]